MIRGLPLQDGVRTDASPNVGVKIGVASLDHLCPRIHPGVDCFLGLIDASLTVVYSSGAGVVPKGNLRQRKDSLSTITMHVNTVVVFVCIRRWDVSRSVFQ